MTGVQTCALPISSGVLGLNAPEPFQWNSRKQVLVWDGMDDRRAEPPRSIGGDEVALAYANYTGTSSDRYLFIYDAGNDVIRSVKLGYHAEERVNVE